MLFSEHTIGAAYEHPEGPQGKRRQPPRLQRIPATRLGTPHPVARMNIARSCPRFHLNGRIQVSRGCKMDRGAQVGGRGAMHLWCYYFPSSAPGNRHGFGTLQCATIDCALAKSHPTIEGPLASTQASSNSFDSSGKVDSLVFPQMCRKCSWCPLHQSGH